MPELPEVETVRRGLAALLIGARIARASALRPDLRRPIPDLSPLSGRTCRALRRRGKYLLIDADGLVLVNHLGMTGTWRLGDAPQRHDHAMLELADGRCLRFSDPRRFGLLDLCDDPARHPLLAPLGPEPLDDRAWEALRAACRCRRAPIKAVLMDQRVLAGVGNIYAAEACFRAGIRPQRAAGTLAAATLQRLLAALRAVLEEAIAAGGSTIADYRAVNGLSGRFQHRFAVYGRAGQPCRACGATIRSGPLGGRGTCWCPRCQR